MEVLLSLCGDGLELTYKSNINQIYVHNAFSHVSFIPYDLLLAPPPRILEVQSHAPALLHARN